MARYRNVSLKEQRAEEPATTELAEAPAAKSKQAVLYLRVSTPSQVKTDYNPEGISLPAQREACELKCAGLGAEVIKEFVEPGRTATDIEHRPVFREMVAWLKQHDVDYIVVYHFNRIFRNSIDAAITKQELSKRGIRLVSATLDLGDGIESQMVETILHAVDEYRSRADGADISYKMGAKAKSGGTLGRAPLGYLNRRDFSEGRNIGTVILDPERADLIRTAFELYASGDYSAEALAEELTNRGLRTRPGRFPAGPVSTSKLNSLLRDPYYVGYVTFKGQLYEGRHERLVSDDLFERVQAVLNERSSNGVRQRRHHHYLKGVLWCWKCHQRQLESRMLMQKSKGNGGTYQYFFCRRRQQRECDTRYVESEAIEAAIIEYYDTLAFPADLADRVRSMMHETLDEEATATKERQHQLQLELDRLERQEANLVVLVADGSVPSSKAKKMLGDILRKRNQVQDQLGEGRERLAVGAELIENALQLLSDPGRLYEKMAPEQRRLFNQAVFEKMYVIDNRIEKVVLKQPFFDLAGLRDAAGKSEPHRKMTARGRHCRTSSDGPSHVEDLDGLFLDPGSSKGVMVGAEGLEPPACWL